MRLMALCAFGLVLLPATERLSAQSRNVEITGIVTDKQGSVISGAAVDVTNEATGVKLNTLTNEAGVYRIQYLTSGTYSVEGSMQGFQRVVHSGFLLQTGQVARLDIVLEVGEMTQKVEVTAAAPLMQTESSEVSRSVVSREMQYQPNLNRDFNTLLSRNALAVNGQAGSYGHGLGFYVNGAQQQRRDDSSPGDFNSTVDVVRELRILSNGFSAEFKGPAAIILETKSGTNEYHGTGYLYIRDQSLNANPWGARTKLPFRQTDPGFTVGGPIFRNRTFFFGAYQRRKVESSSPLFLSVPSLLQRGGDFSRTFNAAGALLPIYNPLTTRPDPANTANSIRDVFPGNVIPQNQIDPVGSKILGYYADPNQPGTITGALNFFTDQTSTTIAPQFNLRLDHLWNTRHRTSGSWVGTQSSQVFTNIWPNPGTDGSRPNKQYGRTYTFSHTYTPSASWVLESSYSMLDRRYQESLESRSFGYPRKIGLKGVDQEAHFPQVGGVGAGGVGTGSALPGYSYLGGSTWANQGSQISAWSYSFAQRFAYSRSQHNIKFGVEYLPWRHRYSYRFSPSGQLGFGTQSTGQPGVAGTGNAAASVLVGLPLSAKIDDIKPDRKMGAYFLAGYIQEDWKVRRTFTINAGVRWETDSPNVVTSADTGDTPYLTHWNASAFNPVSGTPGSISYAGKDSPSGLWQQHFKQFQPRIGFAWQVNPKTVVRANGGLFFRNPMGGERISGVWELAAYGLPGYLSLALISPDNGITHPFRLVDGFPPITAEPAGPGFGAVKAGQSPRLDVIHVGADRTPFGYDWATYFGIQRELPGNMLVEAAYVGRYTRHFYNFLEQNQVLPQDFGPGNAQIRRPFPQYGNVTLGIARDFTANFNALMVRVEKRYSNGLSLESSYVFNKQLSNFRPWNAYDASPKIVFAPQHRWVSWATYDLPWGPGKARLAKGPVSRVLGGWVLSGVLTLQSGGFLDVSSQTDTTNGFLQGNQGVNVVGGNPNLSKSERSMARFFNTSVFAFARPYTLGNAGRSLILGPGTIGFDTSLNKSFKISERFTTEFKADFINALNHPNMGSPSATLGSPTFGLVTSKSGNRNIMLGIKLLF
jgi:hypothetical protein